MPEPKKVTFVKLEAVAFLIVWLSSLLQLFLCQEATLLKWQAESKILIGLGIILDLCILVFAIVRFIGGKNSSVIPGIGGLFYWVASVSYGKLMFLEVNSANALLLSFFKAVELLILSSFHFLCMFIAGTLAGRRGRR